MSDEYELTVHGPCDFTLPTEQEMKDAWKREYVRIFVAVGVDAETAASWFDNLDWQEIVDLRITPKEAADEEMSYWQDDGDAP